MSALAVVSVVLGAVVIAARAPLLVAPQATVAVYRRLLERNGFARLLGAVFAALGAALIGAGWGSEPTPARIMLAVGWLLTGSGGLMLAAPPSATRRFVESILGAIDDPAALRILGGIGVAVGLGFLFLGLRVL